MARIISTAGPLHTVLYAVVGKLGLFDRGGGARSRQITSRDLYVAVIGQLPSSELPFDHKPEACPL